MPNPDQPSRSAPSDPVDAEEFTIRSLGYTDLPQIIAIERRAFPTPWSAAMFVLELSKPSGISVGAFGSGRQSTRSLAGYVIASRYADIWHLMNVAVDPPLRRRGVATALLEDLIRRVGTAQPVTLEVRPSNSGAIALYERFGFRPAGVRPKYYRDTGEDALIMWRGAATALAPEASQ